MTSSFYLALTPWLAFVASDRSAGLGPAYSAAIACAVAMAVFGNDLRLHSRHALPPVAAAGFGSLTVAIVALHDPQWVGRFDRTIAAAFLAGCLLGSLAREPLTAGYGRQRVTPRRAASAAFRDHQARVALWWSSAIGLIAVSFTLGALVRGRAADTVFNWLLPMVLIVFAASRPAAFQQADLDEEVSWALDVVDVFTSHEFTSHDGPRSHLKKARSQRLYPMAGASSDGAGAAVLSSRPARTARGGLLAQPLEVDGGG
ncbi:MAG TPA: hypothetical protein VME46_16950 [Acidimicrobiales bacterium]|nr:hypothetical protein [Acidimicrobiales bacterium]